MNPFQHQQGRGYNPYNSRPGDCNREQCGQFTSARSRPLLQTPPPEFRMEQPRGQAHYNIGNNFQQRLPVFQMPNLWNYPESQFGNRSPNIGRGVRNQFPVSERGGGSQTGFGFPMSGQNYSGVQDSVRNGNLGGFGFNNAFGSGGQLNIQRNAAANLFATGGGQGFSQSFQHSNPGFSQRQSSNEAYARVNNQFHKVANPLPSRDSHLKKSQRTKTLRYLDVNLNDKKVSTEVHNMSESSNLHLSNQNAANSTNQKQFDIARNSTTSSERFLRTVSQIQEKSNISDCNITTPNMPLPRKTMEASSSKESGIVGNIGDQSAVDCDSITRGRSVGLRQNENEFMQGLSNMNLASSYEQDVHTKATTTTNILEGTSDQNDCVIVNPSTCRETTPQHTPTPTKTKIQTSSKTNNGQKSPSSCQEESNETTSQASPFQKFGNPEIKTKETSPASPFQKIGNAETRTDKICEPQGNDSLCGSLLSGEREKTGLNAALFSPKVSLHKQASSGGSCMDPVNDNASLGQAISTVGNSANDREKTVSKNPNDVAGGRFNKGDGAEIPRQRILSGESQRYSAKGWLARVEKKRHQSEDTMFKRENSSPLKHRESTDSGTASQDRKQHSMLRSQSDSSQEITPESAQTYKEYREAKQRLLEKEKEEQSRRRSQQKLSSSSSETPVGGVRQGPVQKTAESYSSNASRGGQAGDSIDMVDSKFCIVYGADVPSPEDDGDRHSDLDIDLDLDDSDDELLEAPSFLKDLENAITQPVPRTPPPKLHSSPAPGSPVPGAVSSSVSIPSTSRFAKFSLDSLLEEHTNKPQEQREYEEMHAELKESVKQGGFVKDTLEKQDDPSAENLLPEHQEQIEHLEMKKSVICPAHPGETIFCSSRYQQLFTPSITPTMCGFSPGESYIDKFLSSVQPRNFGALLSSEVLVNCLEKVTHPKPILKWLLFLLSVDGSHLAMDGCCKALEEYLYTQKVFHEDENPWAPCVEDILSIFMNCGASKEDVLPTDVFKDEEISSLSKGITREANIGLPPPNAGSLNRENLRLVLQVLALALQRRPKYDISHLTALYVMLCRVALDKSLSSGIVNIEVQSCLGSILCCYPESEWKTCAIKLCSILPCLTEHHHNKACLASLSPYGRRGQYLQRRVSYLMLRQLFDMEPSPEDKIENCKIRDLHQFLPHLQQLVTSDMYKLYSCITLIDLCVGNGVISPGEKDSLQYLSEQIKKISGDTRDDVRVLDRSRVKDQMVRLTSKWTLRLLTVGSNQRSIFSYTTSRAPQTLEIETVQASQTDESQSEPESDVDMADPLDEEEPQSL